MVYTREEAARRAEASTTNVPNTCQLWTRTQFGVPSAGDYDGDGDADAVDGWKKEHHKHPGDRNPPRGVPVSWSGGSHGYGHRAISLGNGLIRSTDAGGSGRVATVPLDWPERHWGLHYLGWSEDCDGVLIPHPAPKKEQTVPQLDHPDRDDPHYGQTQGPNWEAAKAELRQALANARQRGNKELVDETLTVLRYIRKNVRWWKQ